MPVPNKPQIYHIVHVDRLQSIINDENLWSDREMNRRAPIGTNIGMNHIKERRLNQNQLDCYPHLFVGDCVPFYFCPRSVMLYLMYKNNNQQLQYDGGQEPIIHLKSNFHETVKWASVNNRKWVFTLSNAGARYFEDKCHINEMRLLKWESINTQSWQQCREEKQAEFLIEHSFPWHLIDYIGVHNKQVFNEVRNILQSTHHCPKLQIEPTWYY